MSVCQLLTNLGTAILNPLAALIFASGLLLFIWGIVQFMWNLGSDESRDKGRQHMFWGIIGMAIMLSAYAVINVVANTFGLTYPVCA
jgi:uncharacterized membrane protein YidH (DUF202 family)